MHNIHKILLKRLKDKNPQKYSSLTQGYSYEDNVVFHLKKLLEKNLIKKVDSEYLITISGVKEITKYDLKDLEDTGFKTFFIGFLCNYKDNFLVKEHPQAQNQVNFYNLPSGKPRFGEAIDSALVRTFQNNTGLKLMSKEFKFISLHLKTVKSSLGETIFDDAFTIYKVDLNKENFEQLSLEKHIKCLTKSEIAKLKNIWPEIDICILKDSGEELKKYMVYEFVSDYVLDKK